VARRRRGLAVVDGRRWVCKKRGGRKAMAMAAHWYDVCVLRVRPRGPLIGCAAGGGERQRESAPETA